MNADNIININIDDDEDEEDEAVAVVVNDNLGRQLLQAARVGNVEQVENLLDEAVDIDTRDANGLSVLDWASRGGHVDVVTLLLDRGADIENDRDHTGWTRVFYAAMGGHFELIKLFHSRGSNIHHTSQDGVNALILAAWCDQLPICEFLLSKGADLMATSNDGRSALSVYGQHSSATLSPETTALRCAALQAAHAKFRLATLRSVISEQRGTIEDKDDEIFLLKKVTHNYASLLFSDAFSDLVFVCPGGERIHAHRNIVSACSPHARVLLQGPWAENADERVAVVQMPQSAPAVRALLRFLYTGEVDAAAVQTSMSDVLDLASQHEQPALKAACERNAIAALSLPTVVPILVTAHLHELAALKAACVDLIMASAKNATAVTMSKVYMKIETSHPHLWRELRAALGMPEEEEDEQEEEEQAGKEQHEQQEGQEQDRKRARHES